MICSHCYDTGYDASGYDCTCGIKPASVAKVGRRIHGKKPLPASPAHAYLRHLSRWMLIAITVALASALILAFAPRHHSRVIDCSMAEFHPDFTQAMKRACRNTRTHT